jgi:quercetin dioxygenase-like cupin family protein
MAEPTNDPQPATEPELIEDPVMRQRYRLSRQGDVLRNELQAEPGAHVPAHFHPTSRERFEIVEGEFTFKVDGQRTTARPGDRLEVEPGQRHSFKNTGTKVGSFVAEIEPPLDMEQVFKESAVMARQGMFLRPGIPKGIRGLLAAADFSERYRDTMVLTFPPPVIQRILFPPLARLYRRRQERRAS